MTQRSLPSVPSMESADTTIPADRTTPRRWRRLGFVLVILVAMEAAGWIGDHLLDFRQKLLWRLTLMEVEAAPTTTGASTVPRGGPLDPQFHDGPDPEEPYRVGQTKIQGAGPWIEHLR
ncbi:MAG: hypothetical protein Ct9H300mP1_34720 [Planctomycetaceae bacterium]|nr:MAG: hypothetical protein Ct9H300mP1_34720 [Planctomycetaceae bacterium]